MAHHHHHHDHLSHIESMSGIFVFSIVLNLIFVVVEAGVGFCENSLSLLSDAGHNLSDVFSLLLVLVSFKLANVHASKHYTYGLKKSTILISLVNAVTLLVAVGAIIFGSVNKFFTPVEIDGAAISWTAFVGIIINGLTAILLMRGQQRDLNVRGAFLHMAADTLVSLGVVVSGVVITYTGWNIIDPIVSLIIAVVILVSTWQLLSQSVRLSLDGTPEGIDIDAISAAMAQNEHVDDVHHIHVWAISTTQAALTAHVVVDDITQIEEIKADIKHRLADMGITHSTIEMETTNCHCTDHDCCCDTNQHEHHCHHDQECNQQN